MLATARWTNLDVAAKQPQNETPSTRNRFKRLDDCTISSRTLIVKRPFELCSALRVSVYNPTPLADL